MKGSPGYVALVLDWDTQIALRGLSLYPNEYSTHVTMAYRPTPEVYAKYQPLMGQVLEFEIPYCAIDGKAQAAAVLDVPSENKIPHITMSCVEGVKPSHSNQMLADPEVRLAALGLRGRGRVMWIDC
jgi:hypothetical protein